MSQSERPQVNIDRLFDTSRSVFEQLHSLSHESRPEQAQRFHPYFAHQLKKAIQPLLHSLEEDFALVRPFITPIHNQTSIFDTISSSLEATRTSSGNELVAIDYKSEGSPEFTALQFRVTDLHYQVEVSRSSSIASDSFRRMRIRSEVKRDQIDSILNLAIEEAETTVKGGYDPQLVVRGSLSQVHRLSNFSDSVDLKACAETPFSFLPMRLLR